MSRAKEAGIADPLRSRMKFGEKYNIKSLQSVRTISVRGTGRPAAWIIGNQ
jgi:hypothetical protein